MSDGQMSGVPGTWPPAATPRSRRPLIIVGVCVLLVVVGVALVVTSRGGGGPDRSTPEGALEQQVRLLADGRAAEVYQQLHPAQRAIVSQDTYVRCTEDASGLELRGFEVKAITDENLLIPGTDQHADSKAITVALDVGLGPATDTYHEILVDGKWTFTATAAEAMSKGDCS